MITILHGDDITASRNYLFELKKDCSNIQSFDGEKITITDLTESLESKSLFQTEDNKLTVIENIFAKKGNTQEGKIILEYIKKNSSKDITIWEAKELTKKTLSFLPNANVKLFKIPVLIFTFLDSFRPTNGKVLINLFHKILKDKDEEFVLYMLTRHLRMLLALSQKSRTEEIDELQRLSPWQKSKLESQVRLFTIEKLIKLYFNLYNIDLNLKTGKLNLTLAQAIDFFLLDI